MRLEYLETFCAVVEEKSFSAAAKRLNLSQSTVSAHIRGIEDELGACLLMRQAQPLALSEVGQRVLPFCHDLLVMARQMKQVARGQGSSMRRLRVGAGFGVGEFIIPRVMADYHGDLKELELVLSVGNHKDMVDAVLTGAVDISIVGRLPPSRLPGRLTEIPFMKDEMVVVVPVTHAWAGRPEITAEEMLEEVYVLREKDSSPRRVLDSILAEHGLLQRLRVVGNYGSNRACVSAVISGLGASILPLRTVTQEVSAGLMAALRVPGLPLVQHLQITCLAQNAHRPDIDLFINCLKKFAARQPQAPRPTPPVPAR